jgi:isopenicillin N synthase-like dioxygenase
MGSRTISSLIGSVDSLPGIDFSAFSEGRLDPEQQAIAQQIHDVCTGLGFFYLSHHRLPETHIPEPFKWSGQFFEQLREAKMMADSRNRDVNRSNNPLPDDDGERLSMGAPDFKETFDMCRKMQGRDLEWSASFMGTNQWPDSVDIPGFADFM